VSNAAFDDDDLHAYADGQLPPARVSAFEAALAANPELSAQVAAIRAQNDALRSALDAVLAEPIPPALLRAASPPSRLGGVLPVARRHRAWLAAAASLAIGIAVGWFGRTLDVERQGTPVTFPREAAYTHALYAADVNRPVEVWANEEKRLVTWLTKRLGHPVHAPDLNALGYTLVGGRLVAGNRKPTAMFMYENPDRQRLSLQVRWQDRHASDTAFRYAVEDGVGVFYWIDDNCSYAISGSVDRAQLLALARVVYGQIAEQEAKGRPAPRRE